MSACSCFLQPSSKGVYAILLIAQIVGSGGTTPLLSLTSTYLQVAVFR